jgi:hypothetical protein
MSVAESRAAPATADGKLWTLRSHPSMRACSRLAVTPPWCRGGRVDNFLRLPGKSGDNRLAPQAPTRARPATASGAADPPEAPACSTRRPWRG